MIRWVKPALFLACLGPAAWLVYGAFLGGDLGVNPVETITNYTGLDPEVGAGAGSTGSGLINQTDAFGFPTLRTFSFSLSTRF